jgi:hypothetical protein
VQSATRLKSATYGANRTGPEQWVHWPKLYNRLDLKKTEAAGMLGAAERRCKGAPPYVKTKEDGEYYFWMPKDVAALIVELATA